MARAKTTKRSTLPIHANGSRSRSAAGASASHVAAYEVERLADLTQEGDRARDDRGDDFELVARRPAEPHHGEQQHDEHNSHERFAPMPRSSHRFPLPLRQLFGTLGR